MMRRCDGAERRFEASLTLALAVLIASTPAVAKGTSTFNPVVALEERFEDNVQYIATEDDAQSDWSTRFGAVLPWNWESKKSNASIIYAPTLVRYQEFSNLDHMANRLDFRVGTRFSPRSSFSFNANARRIQSQGSLASVEDPDLALNQRTTRNLFRVDLSYDLAMSERWDWQFGAGAGAAVYEDIEERDPADGPSSTEDRVEYRASTAMVREMSRRARFGARYLYSRFELDFSGREDIHALALTGSYEASRKIQLSFDIGAFYRTDYGDGTIQAERASTSDFLGRLQLVRTFRHKELMFYARHAPSSGGSRVGTSTNSVVGIQLASRETQNWNWSGAVRYAYRDPTDPLLDPISTGSLGGYAERAVSRSLGLRLRTALVNQDNIYFNAGLMLTWYPKQRSSRGGYIP